MKLSKLSNIVAEERDSRAQKQAKVQVFLSVEIRVLT